MKKHTKIHEMIMKDRRSTIDELVNLTGVSWSSWQRILIEESGMKRVAAKTVPRLLTGGQKQSRMDACRGMKEQLGVEDRISKIITGD